MREFSILSDHNSQFAQFVNCISLNEIEMLIVEIKKNGNTMVRNVSTKLIVLTVLYHF